MKITSLSIFALILFAFGFSSEAAYSLKATGIAQDAIVCVGVGEDGSIQDFAGNTITLGTGVAGSVATGSWKGSARKFFTTTPGADPSWDFYGVEFDDVSPPVADEGDGDGMSVWFAAHGAGANTNNAPYVLISGAAGEAFRGLRRNSSGVGQYYPGDAGATVAAGSTTLPTDGTTKFSLGANYTSNGSSQIFYGLESGSLSADSTSVGPDGGWGGLRGIHSIGGTSGNGNAPFQPYMLCVFDRQLSEAEFDSLHDDWFSVLLDDDAGPSAPAPAVLQHHYRMQMQH